MIIDDLASKRDALETALDLMSRGHESLTIVPDDDGVWSVYTHGHEIFPDYPEWTYDDGINLTSDEKTGRDVTQLFEPCESLITVAHFTYHLSNVSDWLENTRPDSLTLDWSPVEDGDLRFCAECEAFHDPAGETLDDNIIGHVYGAIIHPHDC